MKNIKKSFALLLAFCLIFGICTIGAGATTPVAFTDAASVNSDYATAVDVMSGMGILVGSDDNNDGKLEFNPTGTVTRAQAAKMVTYMILGSSAADKLPSKTQFSDVKSTDWAAKYIYYLSNKGIINGYGDGNFGPSDTVTATQMSKLLLSACGYGKVNEFTGEGWDVNVFNLAVDLGIYTDTKTADYDVAATREEAAMYVFNTMTKINLVSYNTDDAVYNERNIDGGSANYAQYKYNYTTLKGTIVANSTTGATYTQFKSAAGTTYNLDIDTDTSLIGHEVEVYYNTDEQTNSNSTSASNKYYYDTYYIDDLSTVVAIGFNTNKQVYNGLGGSSSFDYNTSYSKDFKVWMNYSPADTTNYPVENYKLNWANLSSSSPNTYAYWQPTNLMKVYNGSYVLDEDGYIIAFVNTYYTDEKVTSINTTSGSESITLNYSGELSNTKSKDIVKEYDGIAKGDFVSVTFIGGVYYLEKCKEVDDVYISTYGNDFLLTINSTYYGSISTAATTNNHIYKSGDSLSSDSVGSTYDLYLDKNGYYVYATKVDSADTKLSFATYLYFDDSTSYGTTTDYKLYAQCVDSTGTEQDYLITPSQYAMLDGASSADAVGKSYTGAHISYTYNTSTGDYTLKSKPVSVAVNVLGKVSSKTDSTYYNSQKVYTFDTKGMESILNNGEGYTFSSSSKLKDTDYLDDSGVTYIYVDGNQSKLDITTSKNKPSSGTKYDIYYYPVKVSSSTSSTTNYTSSVVFISSAPKTTTITSLIYSYGYDANNPCYVAYTNSDGDSYVYAYLDGVYTKTIKVESSELSEITSGSNYLTTGFYSYEIDSSGYYDLTKYTGVDDKTNASVNDKAVTNIYDGKISAGALEDVTASDAKVINLNVNYTVKTLDDIADLISDNYTVNVSFCSYNYKYYAENSNYGIGSSYITTDAIYVTSITKNKS